MTIFSLLQDINAIGTLILATIAVIAILVPIVVSKYQRPKFLVLLQDIRYEEVPPQEPELRISITNLGKYAAHACKIMAAIEDSKGEKLGSYYLPWIWEDPSKYSSIAEYSQDKPLKYIPNKEVTYVPIDIFPYECISTKFLFWPEVFVGSPDTSFLAVFGASHTYYYYPIWDKELKTVPPLTEYHPYLAPPKEYDDGLYLKKNTTYSVDITIFSEEHTYLNLRKFYFKFGDKGTQAGYTPECKGVNL